MKIPLGPIFHIRPGGFLDVPRPHPSDLVASCSRVGIVREGPASGVFHGHCHPPPLRPQNITGSPPETAPPRPNRQHASLPPPAHGPDSPRLAEPRHSHDPAAA